MLDFVISLLMSNKTHYSINFGLLIHESVVEVAQKPDFTSMDSKSTDGL